MSKQSNLVFAGLAAAATLGAVQLAAVPSASTATLADRFQAVSELADAVNRAAKGDRDVAPSGAAPGRTVLLKTESLADTSVLIRIPVQKDVRNVPAARPGKAKIAIACEPVVSLLTEVAKLLQPGKCVT